MDTITTLPRRYLLTTLGLSPRLTSYGLRGRQVDAQHVPLALLQLLEPEDRPEAVLCLLTPTAREKAWPTFRAAAENLQVEVEPLEIPEGDDAADIDAIIRVVASRIEVGAHLLLDITHGPRHVPVVMYALALYLSSLRDVVVDAVWYGKFETPGAVKPLINLVSLLDFPRWFPAITTFRDTGSTGELANRFDAVAARLPEGPERGQPRLIATALRDLSVPYESGLPLETGLAAGKVCHLMEHAPLATMSGLDLPQANALNGIISQALLPLRFETEQLRDGKRSGQWKSFTLTAKELQRQARMIDQYLERKQLALALALMREWVVSLGILYRGHAATWLKRDTRIGIERELGALAQSELREHLDENQQRWGQFWGQLGQQRNQIAHCGMKPEVAKLQLDDIRTFWSDIKDAGQAWPPFGGGKGSLLISPLGMSPGVLYSAIKKTEPAVVLALCSNQSRQTLEVALQASGHVGKWEALVMRDPVHGYSEIADLQNQARRTCLDADKVLVNLTGGTTMMGIVTQKIFERASRDQRPCRRFVLGDQRSPDEQKASPWVESDIFWLDAASDAEKENDCG